MFYRKDIISWLIKNIHSNESSFINILEVIRMSDITWKRVIINYDIN